MRGPPQPAACGRTGELSALTRGWTLWDAQGGALGRLDGTHGQRVLTPPPRCRPGRALGAPEGAPGEGDRAQGCPGCCAHTGRGPRCVPCGIRAPSVERPVADSCRPPPQVVGLRDVLHQARPAARRGHRHRQLLHLPDEQEEGTCRAVWRGPTADRLGVRALTPAGIAPASSASVLRFGERGRRHRLASRWAALRAVLCLSSPAPRPHPGLGGERTRLLPGPSPRGPWGAAPSAARFCWLPFHVALISRPSLAFHSLCLNASLSCRLPGRETCHSAVSRLPGPPSPGFLRRPFCKPTVASWPPGDPRPGSEPPCTLDSIQRAAVSRADQVPRRKWEVTGHGSHRVVT